ncbi:methyltransferase [Collinsella sp. AGMB00827]|uniref:tRNA (guanine(46)-N(7))-methyltransferase n=1 Tax=Collinsella ureilytica TaxID=2869515 RepID=A0ABS7MML3_9ACTN|nr:methyltransferase [Collinsella urealyticum]
MHARTPKNFVLEERLERYSRAIETHPHTWRGIWAQASAQAGATPFQDVHLDLGCGKGLQLVEAARQAPHTLHIGVDSEPICIAYAAQAITEAKLANAIVVPARADQLCQIFADDELSSITISFPTPFPRKKQAHLRVVQIDRLLEYRSLLAPGAALLMRTDSQPLFDFTLTQLKGTGMSLEWVSSDLRRDRPELPASEYERKLVAQGARVLGLLARPEKEPDPAAIEQARAVPQSLFEYVPDDLYEGAYIPHGMSWAIETFRNRRARAARRKASHESVH